MWRVKGHRREAWSQTGTELALHKYLWNEDLRRKKMLIKAHRQYTGTQSTKTWKAKLRS